jgi:hypothetical protein
MTLQLCLNRVFDKLFSVVYQTAEMLGVSYQHPLYADLDPDPALKMKLDRDPGSK